MKFILSLVILLSLLSLQCTKNEDNGFKSLKESLNSSTQDLNAAVIEISQTKGYELLNIQDNGTAKSLSDTDPGYQDSITLAMISGVYEYNLKYTPYWNFWSYHKMFEKTGDSSLLVVKMPSEKIFKPWRFRNCQKADSTLLNNFVITATDYHLYASHGWVYDYKLAAGVAVKDSAIGQIGIESKNGNGSSYSYASEFTFPNGYTIKNSFTHGDSAISMISLSDSSKILFQETVTRIKSSTSKYREKLYSILVGNVEFKKVASDSLEVYVDGVLQPNATVEFITQDNNGEEGGMCRKKDRDIQITFEDGTQVLLSELISPSLTIIQGLVKSLGSIYFAKNVVDYIALSIYFNH